MSFPYTARPPSFLNIADNRLKHEIDKAISILFSAHSHLSQRSITAPGVNGITAVSGSLTILGSKSGITTGLTKVDHVTVSIDSGGVASNQSATANVNGTNKGKIDIQVWMPTAAGDTTPIASTVATVINWFCTGS